MKSETLFNRFWRRRGAIKVIIFIILIIPWLVACNEEGGPTDPGDEDPAEVFDDSVTDSEGDLTAPHDAKVTPPPLTDPSVLSGSGPEVLSAYPPEIDRDADGFVDQPLPARPDIRVDNCPDFSNPDQEDSDGDGLGDACE